MTKNIQVTHNMYI